MEIQLLNPFFLKKPVKEWGKLNQNIQLQDLGDILYNDSIRLKEDQQWNNYASQ